MPNRTARNTAILAALVATLGCDAPLPTYPARPGSVARATTDAQATPPWSRVVDGETGRGSMYRLYMPASWNGKLVVYAHGIMPTILPVSFDVEADSVARIWGEMGYGVAMSTYSETGLAVKDGAQRTHQLRGLFASRFGKPARTYLAGRSLGGYVVTALAEKYPGQYDGVLPFCGVVGGFPSELEYVFTARLLFDHFYRGVLPGRIDTMPLPPDLPGAFGFIGALQGAAVQAIVTDARPLPGALQIALIDQSRMPLPAAIGGPLTSDQFGAFVVTPLVLHALFVNDIVEHTHGHMPFGNTGTTYSSTGVPFMAGAVAALNASVARVDAERDAVAWMAHNGDTSGELGLPMLSLHTRYDTWVPIATESIYAAKVARAGDAGLLVQRTTEGWDHCNFTSAELATGLADLARWVEQGVKPAP